MRLKGLLGAAGGAVLAVGVAAGGPAGATPRDSASVYGDTLTVDGGRGADTIVLRVAANNANIVEVDFGGDGTADASFDRATFTRIEVLGGSGADNITIATGLVLAANALSVDGGSGADVINGGTGSEILDGGRGADLVDGNGGVDTSNLGSGNDVFRWDPGDGSDVVDGRSGYDTMDFNGAPGAEVMSLAPNGGRSVFLRSPGNIRMDMDSVEALDLDALGGVDAVTVEDMSGTGMRLAEVDLSANGSGSGGDQAADTVTVNGTGGADDIRVETDAPGVVVEGLRAETAVAGSEADRDILKVNSLGGNDDVDVDDDVAGLIQVLVDLGTGQL